MSTPVYFPDFNDSLEEINDTTSADIPILHGEGTTEIYDEDWKPGSWQWDSSYIWFAILFICFLFLMVLNLAVYLRSVRILNITLCDFFFIFFAFICRRMDRPTPRRARTEEPSALYRSTSMEFIDAFQPSPFCCFRDYAHEESQATWRKPQDLEDPDNIVDLRQQIKERRAKVEERRVRERNEKKNILGVKVDNKAAEKMNDLDYSYRVNLNKETEKIYMKEKLQLQTIYEDCVIEVEAEMEKNGDRNAKQGPSCCIYPSKAPKVDKQVQTISLDPEIFI